MSSKSLYTITLKGVSQVMLQENIYTGLLFFIAIFYVNPYVQASFAEMYTFNKQKAYQEGYIR